MCWMFCCHFQIAFYQNLSFFNATRTVAWNGTHFKYYCVVVSKIEYLIFHGAIGKSIQRRPTPLHDHFPFYSDVIDRSMTLGSASDHYTTGYWLKSPIRDFSYINTFGILRNIVLIDSSAHLNIFWMKFCCLYSPAME